MILDHQKIEKIKNPKCSILFYGKEKKIQLRVKAECEVNYNNKVTKESWEKLVILVGNVIW